MNKDPVWQAFARTGDPVYYLLYKTVQSKEKEKSGDSPRPD